MYLTFYHSVLLSFFNFVCLSIGLTLILYYSIIMYVVLSIYHFLVPLFCLLFCVLSICCSVFLSAVLSVCCSIILSVVLSVYHSMVLSFCLFYSLTFCLSIILPVVLSIYPYMVLSVVVSVGLWIYCSVSVILRFCLSFCPSVVLFLCHSGFCLSYSVVLSLSFLGSVCPSFHLSVIERCTTRIPEMLGPFLNLNKMKTKRLSNHMS